MAYHQSEQRNDAEVAMDYERSLLAVFVRGMELGTVEQIPERQSADLKEASWQGTALAARREFWIIPQDGRVDIRYLTADEILDLEGRGFERFTIGLGMFPAIAGFAETPADVGELRRIVADQSELLLTWRR